MRETFKFVQAILEANGIIIHRVAGAGEYRVYPKGRSKEDYYTTDLQDAKQTGLKMANDIEDKKMAFAREKNEKPGKQLLSHKEVMKIRKEAWEAFLEDNQSAEDTDLEFFTAKQVIKDMIVFFQTYKGMVQ